VFFVKAFVGVSNCFAKVLSVGRIAENAKGLQQTFEITKKDRLIYRVDKSGCLEIARCGGHYE
jgi:hypothetical protein